MFKSLILHLLSLNLTASILLLNGKAFSNLLPEKIETHSSIKTPGQDEKSLLNTRSYEYFTNSRSQSPLKVLKKTTKNSFMKKFFQQKNKFESENNIKVKGNDIENDNKFLSLQDNYEKDWKLDGKARKDGYVLTTPEENPYSLMLIVGAFDMLCTGTLLTEEWVLTAAHCFFFQSNKSVTVYAGLSSKDEIDKPLNPKVQVLTGDPNHVFIHQNYSKDWDNQNDIALVKVLGKFKITEAVKTMELSQKPWPQGETLDCKLTGFGRVQINEIHPDDYKRKTHHLKITDTFKCFEGYEGITFLYNKPMEDFGACKGDSGGGLICEKLMGVASLTLTFSDIGNCTIGNITKKCGSKDTLSMFTSTYPHLSWINSHIQKFSSASCPSPLKAALLGLFILVVVLSPV